MQSRLVEFRSIKLKKKERGEREKLFNLILSISLSSTFEIPLIKKK